MNIITTKGLTKSYIDGERTIDVLRGIDLEIKEGETIAIVGASGVGKSTLLNILGTLDRPSSGEVIFGGDSVFSFDDKRLAVFRNSNIGFVFQFHHLLTEFSAQENVMIPALIAGRNFAEAAEKSAALLTEVGLKDRLKHKPGELSGGEQQRTAIVRAMIEQPKLILADEPTGNLDKKTGEEVFRLLLDKNKKEGITLVVVTHNEQLASMMNRRLEMTDGIIKELP